MSLDHAVKDFRQPTNHTCGQTAVAMLLSHYDAQISLDEVIAAKTYKDEDGEETGSLSQELATWVLGKGYDVEFYVFDFLIVDLSWSQLNPDQIIERLDKVKASREVPALGKKWSERYVQSYIDFLRAGGSLHIQPYPTVKLLEKLLKAGPIFANVGTQTFFNQGRTRYPAYHQEIADDVDGYASTHSIVIYGKNHDGAFLIADPWSGQYTASSERLVAGIIAAEVECDSLLFTICPGK